MYCTDTWDSYAELITLDNCCKQKRGLGELKTTTAGNDIGSQDLDAEFALFQEVFLW
jgi:hypothetical protein